MALLTRILRVVHMVCQLRLQSCLLVSCYLMLPLPTQSQLPPLLPAPLSSLAPFSQRQNQCHCCRPTWPSLLLVLCPVWHNLNHQPSLLTCGLHSPCWICDHLSPCNAGKRGTCPLMRMTWSGLQRGQLWCPAYQLLMVCRLAS